MTSWPECAAVKGHEHIEERWKLLADDLRMEASKLPPGRARDAVMKRARQLETASKMQNWIESTGLKPPR